MKKTFFAVIFSFFSVFVFAQKSVDDVLKSFDDALLKLQSTNVQASIGYITYKDTETSGSIAEYFRGEIEKAANKTRRIRIVPSANLGEDAQIVVATRGPKFGLKKKRPQKEYLIDGIYREENENIALSLFLRDSDGELVSEQTAVFQKNEITRQKLTLYPENLPLSQTVQQDFDSSICKEKISVAASMLDEKGNLVNILYPGDKVKFKITASSNCYLAILMIDAEGEKQWLPMTNDFLAENVPRYFPDIRGAVLQVADGIFGAEQIIIYAASNRNDLPAQINEGKYKKLDLQGITRKFELILENENAKIGECKITYTVMQNKEK